jgi:hypothetical protein
MVAAVFGSDCRLPASAQSAIGGVKKQSFIGGPRKPIILGGPAKPTSVGGPVKPGLLKPNPIGAAVKRTSPVVPVNKPGSAAVSPLLSKSKCPAPCVGKGRR